MLFSLWSSTIVLLLHIGHARSTPTAVLQDLIWSQQEILGPEAITRICDALGVEDCKTKIAPQLEKSRANYCHVKLKQVEPCMTDQFYKYGTRECQKRLAGYDGCSAYMWRIYEICVASGYKDVKDLIKCANMKLRAASSPTSTMGITAEHMRVGLGKRWDHILPRQLSNTSTSVTDSSTATTTTSLILVSETPSSSSSTFIFPTPTNMARNTSSTSQYVPSAPLTGASAVASLEAGSVPSNAPINSIDESAASTTSALSATGPLATLTAQSVVSNFQEGSIPSDVPVASVSFTAGGRAGTDSVGSTTTVVATIPVVPVQSFTTLTTLTPGATASSSGGVSMASRLGLLSTPISQVGVTMTGTALQSLITNIPAGVARVSIGADGRPGGATTSSIAGAVVSSSAGARLCLRRERIMRD